MKDLLGAFCSGLCFIHCLISGLVLPISSFAIVAPVSVVGIYAPEWFHFALLLPVVTLAFLALPEGLKKHGRLVPVVIACTGLASLLVSFITEAELFALIASLILVVAHLLNRKLTKRYEALSIGSA